MSILGKEWVLKYKRKPEESLWSALLASRAVQNPGQFFANVQVSDLHDPFLFSQMEKAVARIQQAIKTRERIVVYGDYDVDGISGAAVLIHTLRFLGGEVSYRIPHRQKDGYGLHEKYVNELLEQDVKLLITVDLGISCPRETELAQENGMDVIITDHHAIPDEIPPAFAILHPKLEPNYPFDELSGSGVAFKLASALLMASGDEEMIECLIDLASLGTVADCVPLVDENRTIVKLGLKQMEQTKWDGLREILRSAGAWGEQDFSTYTIGFQIGPRLNASGRIDHPYWAIQTLLAEGDAAKDKSEKLNNLNLERQLMTREIFDQAENNLDTSAPILIAANAGWPSGIVGLIAGRLQEKYGKPTFILEDRGDSLVGSARSLPGFHAVQALKKAKHLLQHFGGHEQAAGFHLKKEHYEDFKQALLDHAEQIFADNPIKPQLQIDAELMPGEATLDNIEKIASFAPFGIANEMPFFLLKNVKILNSKPVGKQENHLKFTAMHGEEPLDGIAFQFASHNPKFKNANQLIVQLERNEWNGNVSPQIKLVDFA
jgi:single-stranded-DNA-specific exonuclease